MAIFDKLIKRGMGGSQQRSALTTVPTALWRGLSGAPTATGKTITPESSLAVSAVYACVTVLADSVGALPLHLYERKQTMGRDTKRMATEHPMYRLFNLSPNPELTSIDFRAMLTAHCALRGNAYAYLEWGDDGYVKEMWPLRPDRVTVSRLSGSLVYSVMFRDGSYATLGPENILHIRGLTYDGVIGMSPIELMRQGVALSQAAEEFGARFFGNDARPGVVLMHPGELSDDAFDRLRESWQVRHGGLSNSQKMAILEEGMSIEQIGLAPEHAQFLETRKFQVIEIARQFRVPPHMIQDLERATFSNIEQQDTGFVRHTLRPWLERWEQAAARDTLLPEEKTVYFYGHDTNNLLRGDTESRFQAYSTGRQQGFYSANDIREMENLPPIDGGDVYLIPLNMIPADQAGEKDSDSRSLPSGEDAEKRLAGQWVKIVPDEKRAAAESRAELSKTYLPVLRQSLGRVLRREANDVGGAAKKYDKNGDKAGFGVWLGEFYQEHTRFYERQMQDVSLAYATLVADMAADEVSESGRENIERFVRSYISTAAGRHVARQQARVRDLVHDADGAALSDVLADELDNWRDENEGMANRVAQEETTRINNAVALAVYVAAGVLYKRWVSVGDSCQYCSQLNGRVIAIYEWYLPGGTTFDGTDGGVLRVTRNVGHPPAHAGCDCIVVAG